MIDTDRLILRAWIKSDRAAYAAMCASPAVMRYLGGPNTDDEIDAAIALNDRAQRAHGHCFWALEHRDNGEFIGFCGLRPVDDPARPVQGEIEIGWRLREDMWGKGLAREAALASLRWGWANLSRDRIITFTVDTNVASRRLMERLGMVRRADLDFNLPRFAPGHRLSRHVVHEAQRP